MLQELVEARGIVSEAYTIDRVFLRLLKGGLELGWRSVNQSPRGLGAMTAFMVSLLYSNQPNQPTNLFIRIIKKKSKIG